MNNLIFLFLSLDEESEKKHNSKVLFWKYYLEKLVKKMYVDLLCMYNIYTNIRVQCTHCIACGI